MCFLSAVWLNIKNVFNCKDTNIKLDCCRKSSCKCVCVENTVNPVILKTFEIKFLSNTDSRIEFHLMDSVFICPDQDVCGSAPNQIIVVKGFSSIESVTQIK